MLGKNFDRKRMEQLLSAYIDGSLSPRERARLEARLAQDADLRARLESLRQTVALLRGLPPVAAPRNFLLTPAMVRRSTPTARRLAPALTLATAVSGLLCGILIVGNLITAGWSGPGAAAPAPIPMVVYEETPQVLGAQEAEAGKAPSVSETMTPEQSPPSRGVAVPETPILKMQARSEETPPPREAATFPPDEGVLPTPTSEPTPSVVSAATAVEETTPTAMATTETAPAPPPEEMGGRPAPPLTSWLTVGGMALLTVVLAVLSFRAWRAQ